MMLADLGARILEVEHPEGGDTTRGWGPPFDGSEKSAYYLSINRKKSPSVLDLGTEAGRRSVQILADRADVLLENFAPGALDRLGLSLEALRQANPRLVTGSVTGFGRVGPDRDSVGFDLLAQAGAGLMWVTGDPEGPPQKVGMAVSDVIAGYNLAVGVLAALVKRDATGKGTAVEVDLFSSTVAMLPNYTQACLDIRRRSPAVRNGPRPDRSVPDVRDLRRRIHPRGRNGAAVQEPLRESAPPEGLERRPALFHERGQGREPRRAHPGLAGGLSDGNTRGMAPPLPGRVRARGPRARPARGAPLAAGRSPSASSGARKIFELSPRRFDSRRAKRRSRGPRGSASRRKGSRRNSGCRSPGRTHRHWKTRCATRVSSSQ